LRRILGRVKSFTDQSRHFLSGIIVFCAVCVSMPSHNGHADPLRAEPNIAAQIDFSQTQTLASYRILLSQGMTPQISYMDNPNRIVIDFPSVTFQLTPQNEASLSRVKGTGLVTSQRFGLFSAGRSRGVIELQAPAKVSRIEIEPHKTGLASTLILELSTTDQAAFSSLVQQSLAAKFTTQASSMPSTPSDLKLKSDHRKSDLRPLIMLDPGHGGIDSGAIAVGGTMEKEIVFHFAKTLKSRLEKTGKFSVMMTRETDVFVPLDERVKVAREHQADLMISIHADSLAGRGFARGATVYTRSDRASDAEAEALASAENQADLQAGVEALPEAEEVGDILTDLTRRETHVFSQKLAQNLVGGLGEAVRLNKRPHRSARFVVLKAHDIPSALIELGYLSSKEDVAQLQSEAWREKTALGLERAIGVFFANRTASPQP
jgi:N-acetylmuramoyl-L-alanine amidase